MNIAMKEHLMRLAIYCIAAFAAGLVFGCAVAAITSPLTPTPESLCPVGCTCDSTYFVLDCPDIAPPKGP